MIRAEYGQGPPILDQRPPVREKHKPVQLDPNNNLTVAKEVLFTDATGTSTLPIERKGKEEWDTGGM